MNLFGRFISRLMGFYLGVTVRFLFFKIFGSKKNLKIIMMIIYAGG
jgi:hypothetical protein